MQESTVFGMRWILDLELLLLNPHIARKWNHAKTFFVRSHSLPQNSFLLRQEISRERGLWLLNGDYKKMFLLVHTYLGGQSYCSPPFNPPNPVSSRSLTSIPRPGEHLGLFWRKKKIQFSLHPAAADETSHALKLFLKLPR